MDYSKGMLGRSMGSAGLVLVEIFLLLFGIIFTIFCVFWSLVELGFYPSVKQNRLHGEDDFVYPRFAMTYFAMLLSCLAFIITLMLVSVAISSTSWESPWPSTLLGSEIGALLLLIIFGAWFPPTGIVILTWIFKGMMQGPQPQNHQIRKNHGSQKCTTCGCYFDNRDISRGLQKAAGIGVMSVALPITFLTGGATAFLFGLLPGTAGASLYGSAGDNPELCLNCRS